MCNFLGTESLYIPLKQLHEYFFLYQVTIVSALSTIMNSQEGSNPLIRRPFLLAMTTRVQHTN